MINNENKMATVKRNLPRAVSLNITPPNFASISFRISLPTNTQATNLWK